MLLSCARLFATLWTVAYKAPLSMEFSRQEYWSGLPFPSPGDLPDPGIEPRSPTLWADALPSEPQGSHIEFMMLFNHLILCYPLLTPSMFPSLRVFSSELALYIRWPKYWSFSNSPSNEYSRLSSFIIDWFDPLKFKGFSRVFSNTTVQKPQFFGAQLSLWSNSHIHT